MKKAVTYDDGFERGIDLAGKNSLDDYLAFGFNESDYERGVSEGYKFARSLEQRYEESTPKVRDEIQNELSKVGNHSHELLNRITCSETQSFQPDRREADSKKEGNRLLDQKEMRDSKEVSEGKELSRMADLKQARDSKTPSKEIER